MEATGNLRLSGLSDKRLSIYAAFTPAILHWHLLKHSAQAEALAAWTTEAAILFVDISGFTSLCTSLDVNTVHGHMNKYFTALLDTVTTAAGDVVRFVGDAILCAWFMQDVKDSNALVLATRAACRCALELIKSCGAFPIPELEQNLTIHCGLGAGRVHCFRSGVKSERMEMLISGGWRGVQVLVRGRVLWSKYPHVPSPRDAYQSIIHDGHGHNVKYSKTLRGG